MEQLTVLLNKFFNLYHGVEMTKASFFCIVLCAVGLILLPASSVAEQLERFDADGVQIDFDQKSRKIIDWKISVDPESKGDGSYSIITRDTAGESVSRHLSIDILDLTYCLQESKQSDEIFQEGSALDGKLIVRRKIEKAGPYKIYFTVEIENVTNATLELEKRARLILGPGLGEYPGKGFGVAETIYSYVEPAAFIDGEVVGTRNDFESLAGRPEPFVWFGLHSRYLAFILKPIGNQPAYTPKDVELGYGEAAQDSWIPDRYLPTLAIDLGVDRLSGREKISREFLVFSGPKSTAALKSNLNDFSNLIFFGIWRWMGVLCSGLLWVLKKIYWVVNNWGISIILLAIIVRLIMYPFSQRVLSSQKDFAEIQKKIQPEISRIKKEYKGGEQSERILALYRKHGVSPFAGLKPLMIVMIQLPIFIALFHVLGRAFELRNASFLWIDSLAEPDRFFHMGFDVPFLGQYLNILPVLMAVTTLLTIKMSPAPAADNSQRRLQSFFLIFIAITFFLIFYAFPSGMVLYWTMANLLHLIQQTIVEKIH